MVGGLNHIAKLPCTAAAAEDDELVHKDCLEKFTSYVVYCGGETERASN